ncbi:unnamed protein product [Adineta steineri]|uniref:Calpain catalytic domain-containing protein n=1 Tax=Adineta steineri TaxID=433720 RepID=A0A815E2B3_9BILA|nr:unnamed protein product [Adineta steineri]CAF1305716.1 unnamed protein product [Adineta steineri]
MTKWEHTIRLFEGQDFESIRLKCLKENKLFEDPIFPAQYESLSNNYQTLIPNWHDIIWKRPGEIVEDPQMIVNGIKRTDPNQGDLAGIFHFRFWRYQQWYDIVIDDRLPYLIKQKRLWSARNLYEINEFWVSLFEKAYAKLNGNYTNLGGGLPVNALTDFTGGIEQRFEFKSNLSLTHLNENDLFDFIKSCIDYGSLIACSINADKRKIESVLSNGLVIGHTYSITNYYILPIKYDNNLNDRNLIRLRNPWGNDIEWNGKWSDADPIWNLFDEKTRKRLSIQRKHDGEFWMSFKDFYKEFDVMEVCHISPDTYDEFGLTIQDSKHHWRMWYALGSWRAGENSGGSCATLGCRHGCYYWRNPQFIIELTLNRTFNSNRLCMMIIALMQKPITNNSNEQYIQIRLFRIKPNVKICEKKIYKPDEVERIASTGPYVNRREVSLLLKTTTGAYLIVPSMADVDQNCDFLLRIFSQDTTIGRTFVNIFANDNHEDQIHQNLDQKHSVPEQTPSLTPTTNNVECHPVDIQLYSWSGPSFESGECWHQGHRFINGAIWGRSDVPGSPYCVCEQGKVRIFYSQQQHLAVDTLTILRPTNNASPTAKDLAKWPISNYPVVRQRTVICSANRLGIRVRSRDRCIGCKCSTNGHWLCKKPPPLNKNQTNNHQTSRNNPYSYSDTYQVDLHITTVRLQAECPLGTTPKFCILIERLLTSNITKPFSRYIEIPRETLWIDRNSCTQCTCTLDGYLQCEILHETCSRPCLLRKTRPVSVIYYFPSGSKWLTPPHSRCRSCTCINGQRKCFNCDKILKIDVITNNNQQQTSAIGEFRLLPILKKTKPCILQTSISSHRLIFPGQQIWYEQRCYFCSKTDGRLITC